MFTDPVFSSTEQAFLGSALAGHPAIIANMERYLATEPVARPVMALADLRRMPRRGWVVRNVPNPESVYEHACHVQAEAERWAPAGVSGAHARMLAAVHDVPEAIVTDISVRERGLDAAHGKQVERLALRVIHPARPWVMERFDEFLAQETPEAQWVHDVDKLDPVHVAVQYEAKYPQLAGLFGDVAGYAEPRLKTARGKEMMAALRKMYPAYLDELKAWEERDFDSMRQGWPNYGL